MSLSKLKKRAFLNVEVKKVHSDLEAEFELISSLITMRVKSGRTQVQVTEKMGTKSSYISCLESQHK
ncbi:putative uncharacterized protein [Moritella viscosa]|nr:hypothetical protein [Moritella viscosa]CED59185.1 putative uncharacterized protein [Moritella viscosa]